MFIFAHRGASGDAPENTLSAIDLALEMNVDGIEIDLYEVDGQLVIIHDRWLHRTTSGNGHIRDSSFDYIRSLDAGNGEKIPTLNEVLQLIAGRCLLNIEIKGLVDLNLLYAALDNALLKNGFTQQQLLLSSFNHRLLDLIHRQRPEFMIGALTASYPLEYAKFAERLSAWSVHLNVDFISEHFVQDAHQRGLKVFVYTVDEEADIDAMKAIGVDGIFSNYPTRAKAHLAHN